jgi:hypothetical protein
MNELERLERLLRVEPPAELDGLVQRRLGSAVASLRQEQGQRALKPLVCQHVEPPRARHRPAALHEQQAPAVAVPLAERCVYALGLATVGAQTLNLVARFVWRALAG